MHRVIKLPEIRTHPRMLVAELKRDLSMREVVYQQKIAKGNLNSSEAGRRVEIMRDVLSLVEAVYAEELAAVTVQNARALFDEMFSA